MSSYNIQSNINNQFKGEVVNEISNLKNKHDFLNKKTRNELPDIVYANQNLNSKKMRIEETFISKSENLFNMKSQKKNLHSNNSYIKFNLLSNKTNAQSDSALVLIPPYSPFKISTANPSCNSKNNLTIYNENRLASISHIKLINPKYRNVYIPVLPDSINKF